MLDLLVYLDELLIKNLNSVALNGYIDIRTFRRIRDRTIGGNARISDRNSNALDYKNQKDKMLLSQQATKSRGKIKIYSF